MGSFVDESKSVYRYDSRSGTLFGSGGKKHFNMGNEFRPSQLGMSMDPDYRQSTKKMFHGSNQNNCTVDFLGEMNKWKSEKEGKRLQKQEECKQNLQMLKEYNPWGKPGGGAPNMLPHVELFPPDGYRPSLYDQTAKTERKYDHLNNMNPTARQARNTSPIEKSHSLEEDYSKHLNESQQSLKDMRISDTRDNDNSERWQTHSSEKNHPYSERNNTSSHYDKGKSYSTSEDLDMQKHYYDELIREDRRDESKSNAVSHSEDNTDGQKRHFDRFQQSILKDDSLNYNTNNGSNLHSYDYNDSQFRKEMSEFNSSKQKHEMNNGDQLSHHSHNSKESISNQSSTSNTYSPSQTVQNRRHYNLQRTNPMGLYIHNYGEQDSSHKSQGSASKTSGSEFSYSSPMNSVEHQPSPNSSSMRPGIRKFQQKSTDPFHVMDTSASRGANPVVTKMQAAHVCRPPYALDN